MRPNLLAFGAATMLAIPVFGEWIDLERKTNTLTLETSGVVVASNSQKFSPPALSRWNQTINFLVTEGKRVKPGEVILIFDDANHRQGLRQRQSELAVAKSELDSLVEEQKQAMESGKLALAAAKSAALKAQQKASQPADLIPSVDYQKLVEQKNLADFKLSQLTRREPISKQVRASQKHILELKVKRLSQMVAAIRSEMEQLTVVAPSSGVAVIGTHHNSEKIKIGDATQPSMVVVELVDESKLAVQSEVSEEYSMNIKLGQRVRMYSESTGGGEFIGQVSVLGNSVRRKSRFRPEMIRDVWIDVNQAPQGLKLGGSVQVVIEIENVDDSLAVPRQAIQYQNGSPGVVTRTGWQPVLLGKPSDGKIIVLDGLDAGMSIQL